MIRILKNTVIPIILGLAVWPIIGSPDATIDTVTTYTNYMYMVVYCDTKQPWERWTPVCRHAWQTTYFHGLK